MARKRRTGDYSEAEMPMVAMIDVVFQLFIFFIISMKPINVFTNLTVSRPTADKSITKNASQPVLMRINVYPGDRFALNQSVMSLSQMQKILGKLAAVDSAQSILVMASVQSKHDQLIKVLDMCAEAGLSNLSVLSTD